MKNSILIFGIVTLAFISCNDGDTKKMLSEDRVKGETVEAEIIDEHNSKNSLDWAGL